MNILIGGEKEGTGKTTMAVNISALLATYGYKVAIMDTDKQQSAAMEWARIRQSLINNGRELPVIAAIIVTGHVQDIVTSIACNYDHVIIDAGGRDSIELRTAMPVSDKFYTPVRANQFDLESLERLHTIVEESQALHPGRTKASVFVNCASAHPKANDTLISIEYIKGFNLFTSAHTIKERAAFRKTGYSGLGVHELPSKDFNKDAFNELSKLTEEILHG